MSRKERNTLSVFARVKAKSLNLKQAAALLDISYRQCRRRYQRFLTHGDKGLLHQARGKPSNRATDAKTKQAILTCYQQPYPDFGPTLAAEKLLKDGYRIDHETLRRWLIKAGLWHKRRGRSPHRSWRERRAHFGELVQMDGSPHRWFEDRAPACCLMNMVDDATGTRLSRLDEQETITAAMTLLWKWIERFGIPAALYTDRKNLYVPSEKAVAEAKLNGREELTPFGRACQQLGIRIIAAHSPQAKGRVERSNGVYQDRLVKELRLQQINEMAAANAVLWGSFLDELNEKFAVQARESANYHRSSKGYDLAEVFSIAEQRVLSADWVVRYEKGYYQLERQSKRAPVRSKVEVKRYLNGELHFYYRGREVGYQQLAERPVKRGKERQVYKKQKRGKYEPAVQHPWHRAWSKKQRLREQAEAQQKMPLKS